MLESLRPPIGYTLDYAIGSTFSLDLHTLLTTPLAFTFFDWEDNDGEITSDPFALLESVRRNADKICLFCQAGQISVPRKQDRIFAYLENSVHEVLPPNKNGVFHPKVWVIRYTHSTEPVHYRFLCLSRNLTFDKSWDTILVLDGLLKARANAYSINNPIGDFIKQLPRLATTSPNQQITKKIDQIQYEIRRVDFQLPAGVESISFHPIGIHGYKTFTFNPPNKRMLIMSPFLSEHFVEDIVRRRKNCVLISRPDSLDTIPQETLDLYDHAFTLSRDSEIEETEGELPEQAEAPLLSGLHAKLFVIDDGWKANVWTGSANATDAAFQTNVEFLACLRGRVVDLGIHQLLNQESKNPSFADLLEEYVTDQHPPQDEPLKKKLEQLIRETRNMLISGFLSAKITPIENSQQFHLELMASPDTTPSFHPDVKISSWPITLRNHHAKVCNFTHEIVADFGKVTIDTLTAFFVFEVECSEQGETITERFVTKLQLIGVPKERLQKLLRSLLQNRSDVLQFLLLLLTDHSMSIGDLLDRQRKSNKTGTALNGTPYDETPLLESLMKALAHDPSKLDRINRLVNDLGETDDEHKLLPDGFRQIWGPIWEARKEILK